MFCMDSLTLSWRKWTWKSPTSLCVIKKSCTNKGNVSLKHHFLKTLMQEFLSAVEPQMPRWHQNQRRCKHFHLHGRLRGWGLHICDRSIGPNALGRFNQSPRSTVVDGEEWPDPRRSPVSHSWFLTSCRSSRTPVCSEGQRKNMSHMSAPLTPSQPARQPDNPAQWALPHHRRPSIIDEVKCDEVLLWAHKEHTPFQAAMWPNNVFIFQKDTFLISNIVLVWCCGAIICIRHSETLLVWPSMYDKCLPVMWIWTTVCLTNTKNVGHLNTHT